MKYIHLLLVLILCSIFGCSEPSNNISRQVIQNKTDKTVELSVFKGSEYKYFSLTPNESYMIAKENWKFSFPNFDYGTLTDSVVIRIPALSKQKVYYPSCQRETLTALQRETCLLTVKNIFDVLNYAIITDDLTNTWTWKYDIELSDF